MDTDTTAIDHYDAGLSPEDQALASQIRQDIATVLPDAEARLYHRHPVWFLTGNPIVGYHRLKPCLRILFWSGQSFTSPGLTPDGTFKAAQLRLPFPATLDRDRFRAWLAEARTVQWDYVNIVKRKGRLDRRETT